MQDSTRAVAVPLAYVAFVLAAGALVYGFVSVAREGEMRRRCGAVCITKPDYAAADRSAPDFTLKDMTGKDVSLSSYRGKVVILNFWTKTCGPCLEEMPELVELAHILSDRSDVAMLAVSTDDGPDDVKDTLAAVVRTDAKGPLPFTVLFDPDSQTVSKKYGTHLFPETWLIDKRGVVRARYDGARAWSNPAVVELVNQLRAGGYCPIETRDGKTTGEGAKVCDELSGG